MTHERFFRLPLVSGLIPDKLIAEGGYPHVLVRLPLEHWLLALIMECCAYLRSRFDLLCQGVCEPPSLWGWITATCLSCKLWALVIRCRRAPTRTLGRLRYVQWATVGYVQWRVPSLRSVRVGSLASCSVAVLIVAVLITRVF